MFVKKRGLFNRLKRGLQPTQYSFSFNRNMTYKGQSFEIIYQKYHIKNTFNQFIKLAKGLSLLFVLKNKFHKYYFTRMENILKLVTNQFPQRSSDQKQN